MLKARPAREVVVRLTNEIGALHQIARALADRGIDILGISAWVEGPEAVIRLYTEDATRVADTLAARNLNVREAEVVVTEVPHKPGMLRRITAALAQDDIDIHHFYETAMPGHDRALVVLATANNDRAILRLNQEAGHS